MWGILHAYSHINVFAAKRQVTTRSYLQTCFVIDQQLGKSYEFNNLLALDYFQ